MIYQFGRQFIHDDGTPATPAEIEAFKKRNKLRPEDIVERRAKAKRDREAQQQAEKAWQEKYEPKMREFFKWWYEWHEESNEEAPPIHLNADQLIYGLSTSIFDGTNTYSERGVRRSKIVKEITRVFPEYVEAAIQGYLIRSTIREF